MRHRIEEKYGQEIISIFLDYHEEFGDSYHGVISEQEKSEIINYLKHHSDYAGKMVKVYSGSVLLDTLVIDENKDEKKDFYTVQIGDNLSTIAYRFGMTSFQLKTLNHLMGDVVYPGQKLRINKPVDEQVLTYTVKKNESLWSIADKFEVSIDSIKRLNQLASHHVEPGQPLKIKGAIQKH